MDKIKTVLGIIFKIFPPTFVFDTALHPFHVSIILLDLRFSPDNIKEISSLSVAVLIAAYSIYVVFALNGYKGCMIPSPSMLSIISYIYQARGVMGCYCGLIPKMCERVILTWTNDMFKTSYEIDGSVYMSLFLNTLLGVLLTHPFHVLTVSSIAELTANQNCPSSTFEFARRILQSKGINGLIVGLVYRTISELLGVSISFVLNSMMSTLRNRHQETASTSNNIPAHFNLIHFPYTVPLPRWQIITTMVCDSIAKKVSYPWLVSSHLKISELRAN